MIIDELLYCSVRPRRRRGVRQAAGSASPGAGSLQPSCRTVPSRLTPPPPPGLTCAPARTHEALGRLRGDTYRRVLTDPRPEQLGSEAAQSSPQGSNPSEALGRRAKHPRWLYARIDPFNQYKIHGEGNRF